MDVTGRNSQHQNAQGAGDPIREIVIVGGGTAGWMAAASLVTSLSRLNVRIRLVESDEIATVGVGEATIPPIMDFIRQLGIDEDEIIREIKATFKLGIAYRDWTRPGDFYFHPFGPTGSGLGSVSFPACWLKMFLDGTAVRLEEYSIQAMAATQGKFMRPVHAPNTPLNKITYALHFDASLFARYLRQFAEARGAIRIEGKVRKVDLAPEDGFIRSVSLESGETIAGDLFIDCSGFRGLLIERALDTGYEDWSRWLPCDRALVVQSTHATPPAPYTLVTARDAGWQWRVPLQHRAGNGHVYASAFQNGSEAEDVLLANIEGEPLTSPVRISFTPGRRRKFWVKNCVALGLASGFLEPLEATSIHLIQRGIAMLLKFFPDRSFERADIERYNKVLAAEFGRVRDFLLMHYTHTEREGAFWDYCRQIPLTDTLQEKIDLFRSYGRILRDDTEIFPIQSWFYVMIGQNIIPRRHDPLTDTVDARKIAAKLDEMRATVKKCAEAMPAHCAFIETHCLSRLHEGV
ncbi:MAG TPA: tryptophan halogenase family protein [Rhizomicrobium sp.]|jgi:tryptophan halogenase|nr:tryptophan halogenase family protein [Rhizomicrobium sp.]